MSQAYTILKNIFPKFLRRRIIKTRRDIHLSILRKKILRYYAGLPKNKITKELLQILNYLRENSLRVFPYSFADKYNHSRIKVFFDKDVGMRYVLFGKNKLYFKRQWSENRIKGYYKGLLIEQDIHSPHRYVTEDFFVDKNDIVADVGAAEGIFALSVIEEVKNIYLVEPDVEWIEALRETFAPWKEKVQIINKFASNRDDEKNITLDSLFKNKEGIDFLKIDVDGTEPELFEGAYKFLSTWKQLKIALCVYHKQDDEIKYSELLVNKNFTVSYSDGYMLYFFDKNFRPPYLRRGVIRAIKHV